MVTNDEIENAVSKLPIRTRVEAFYKGTEEISKFTESVINPVLKGQLNLSDREKAIVGTYYRMYAWLKTMVTFNNSIHFQGAAAATRALIELLIDIKIIIEDKTGNLVEKFHAFPEIEKFRFAENLVSFKDAYPDDSNIDVSLQRAYVNKPDRKQNIEKIVIRYWGKNKKGKPNYPQHWTGKNIKERAKDLGFGFEELYMKSFPFLSWYVHSGSTGYAGLNKEAIDACFGLSHSIAQEIFLEGMLVCAREMKISEAISKFSKFIEALHLTPSNFLVQELKKLKEKRI
jgi:ACT domain-containing protein